MSQMGSAYSSTRPTSGYGMPTTGSSGQYGGPSKYGAARRQTDAIGTYTQRQSGAYKTGLSDPFDPSSTFRTFEPVKFDSGYPTASNTYAAHTRPETGSGVGAGTSAGAGAASGAGSKPKRQLKKYTAQYHHTDSNLMRAKPTFSTDFDLARPMNTMTKYPLTPADEKMDPFRLSPTTAKNTAVNEFVGYMNPDQAKVKKDNYYEKAYGKQYQKIISRGLKDETNKHTAAPLKKPIPSSVHQQMLNDQKRLEALLASGGKKKPQQSLPTSKNQQHQDLVNAALDGMISPLKPHSAVGPKKTGLQQGVHGNGTELPSIAPQTAGSGSEDQKENSTNIVAPITSDTTSQIRKTQAKYLKVNSEITGTMSKINITNSN
jgi:hypothetical protein